MRSSFKLARFNEVSRLSKESTTLASQSMDMDVAFGNKGSVYLWKKPIDIVGTFIPTLQSHASFLNHQPSSELYAPLLLDKRRLRRRMIQSCLDSNVN